tara:strand:- start:497 stop:649 length:153 start_codon:yes stop_codon:yes gene_type:complete
MWNWIKSLFGFKKEVALVVKQEVVPTRETHCSNHLRFKKSCKSCLEVVYG